MNNEIKLLRQIKHKNIIFLNEIYESNQAIIMVTELVEGGELYDQLMKKGIPGE